MKITNKKNLPQAFVKACEMEENVEGLRVTSLLNGVRATILTKRHWDEIERDAADMVWLIFGTAVHKVLEMTAEDPDEFREQRLSMKISNTTLTGKSDLFKDKVITDYKTTSTYKVKFGEFDDYKKQLLLYAMLWKDAGFEVNGGEVLMLLKDHTPSKRFEEGYPEYPVWMEKWDFSDEDIRQVKEWATERIKLIESLENVPDCALPLCEPEERYHQDDTFAVKKQGVKKADRVFKTRREAEQHLAKKGSGYYIEERKGADRKCQDYCVCRAFCDHARAMQ